MSYRTIVVDNTTYEYVVGKSHVKVKKLGVWSKEDIGDITVRTYGCDCGCYSDEDHVYSKEEYNDLVKDKGYEPLYNIRVRPEHIASKIREVIRSNT